MSDGLIIDGPVYDCTSGIFRGDSEASAADTGQLKEIAACHVGRCHCDAWRAVERRREGDGLGTCACTDVALLLRPALQTDRHAKSFNDWILRSVVCSYLNFELEPSAPFG